MAMFEIEKELPPPSKGGNTHRSNRDTEGSPIHRRTSSGHDHASRRPSGYQSPMGARKSEEGQSPTALKLRAGNKERRRTVTGLTEDGMSRLPSNSSSGSPRKKSHRSPVRSPAESPRRTSSSPRRANHSPLREKQQSSNYYNSDLSRASISSHSSAETRVRSGGSEEPKHHKKKHHPEIAVSTLTEGGRLEHHFATLDNPMTRVKSTPDPQDHRGKELMRKSSSFTLASMGARKTILDADGDNKAALMASLGHDVSFRRKAAREKASKNANGRRRSDPFAGDFSWMNEVVEVNGRAERTASGGVKSKQQREIDKQLNALASNLGRMG